MLNINDSNRQCVPSDLVFHASISIETQQLNEWYPELNMRTTQPLFRTSSYSLTSEFRLCCKSIQVVNIFGNHQFILNYEQCFLTVEHPWKRFRTRLSTTNWTSYLPINNRLCDATEYAWVYYKRCSQFTFAVFVQRPWVMTKKLPCLIIYKKKKINLN